MKDLPLSKVYQLLEPGPVVMLTTARNGRADVMTMSWYMMVEFEPPLVACVASSAGHSFAALRATRECVIAVPAVELAAKVVHVGNCSGHDLDKFAAFGLTPMAAERVAPPLGGRMCRESGMQGGRYAPRQPLQSLCPRGAQGLDGPGAEESQDHPPSRIWQVCRRWRDDQTPLQDAIGRGALRRAGPVAAAAQGQCLIANGEEAGGNGASGAGALGARMRHHPAPRDGSRRNLSVEDRQSRPERRQNLPKSQPIGAPGRIGEKIGNLLAYV